MMEPVSLKSLVVPKSLLRYPEVFGTLDRGCSLTKLLYVKSLSDSNDSVSLEMAFFANKHFSEALDWMAAKAKEEGQLNAGKMLRVTGVGGEKFLTDVKERLNIEVEFIHEFVAQQTGAHFLVNNFDDDVFCYPDASVRPQAELHELPEWLQRMHLMADQHYRVNDGKKFPAIFGFLGSGVAFNKLNEDHSTEVLGISMLGGKSFLGMSKLIVGTNDYQEIMRLAEKGSRAHVDTQVKEMFAQGAASEYRLLPPDLPLFPFGKASETEEDVNYSKEDLAASVIGAYINDLIPHIVAIAKMHRIRRVYLGGHLLSGQPMRDTFGIVKNVAVGMSALRVRFLSNGHTGCIGCLLVSAAEANEKKSRMSMG